MRRRSLLPLGLIALLGALALPSCLSPTLPLPPPEVETVTESTEGGVWQVSGTCTPGALVTVLNDETGVGVVFEDRNQTGQWFVELPAEQCDRAWAAQELGNDASGHSDFVVDTITSNQPNGTGACN